MTYSFSSPQRDWLFPELEQSLTGVHAALLLQAAFTQAIVVRTVCDFGTLYSRFGNRQIEMQIAFQTITP